MAKQTDNIVDLLTLGIGLFLVLQFKKAFSSVQANDPASELRCDYGQPTLDDNQINILAGDIYQAIYKGVWYEDEAAVIRALGQLNNNQDLCNLVKRYGTKAPLWGIPRSLKYTLERYLSAAEVDQVNEMFESKGITFMKLAKG